MFKYFKSNKILNNKPRTFSTTTALMRQYTIMIQFPNN